jgi:hypothetical protein
MRDWNDGMLGELRDGRKHRIGASGVGCSLLPVPCSLIPSPSP